jgi:hypothetical protein
MQAIATAEQTWVPVRCPCGKSVLADVRGGGPGEIRRFCRRCKNWWVIAVATGKVCGAEMTSRASG